QARATGLSLVGPTRSAPEEVIPRGPGAFEHVGDDLHVPVRVCWESGTRSHAIFIDDSEMTKAHILRIMIVPEREGMAAIEPAGLCFTSFSCRSYSNHFIPLLISHLRNTLKTALMSQSQDTSKTYCSSAGHVLGDQVGNCRLSRADMESFYTLFHKTIGRLPAVSTSATSIGDVVSETISQASPTSSIHVPMLDATVAIHSARKIGCASGLHGERDFSGDFKAVSGFASSVCAGRFILAGLKRIASCPYPPSMLAGYDSFRGCVLCDIAGRSIRLFDSNRIAMLGRTVVINEHDRRVGTDCQLSH